MIPDSPVTIEKIAPKDFLEEHYYKKVDYLKDQFGRMWTRFNYFLTVESALFGGKVFVQSEGEPTNQFQWQIALIGFFVSVIWYVMGAEDKYLVNLYRKEIEQEYEKLQKYLSPLIHEEPTYYLGQTKDVSDLKLKTNLFGWRFESISTTTMAAIIPFLLMLIWLGTLLWYLVK
jgi:hypothetical protein